MNITAEITGIKYEVTLASTLKLIEFSVFDINNCPSACAIQDEQRSFALSKWVSPKRTRSYRH